MAARRLAGGGGGGDLDGGFRYNARLGVALVPCAALTLGMGGKPVLGTLTVGLMVSYILDSLMFKRASFFGVWASLCASGLALALSGGPLGGSAPWILHLLAFLLVMQLIFLLGVWASLQFRWLHLENPSVVVALERLLFACTPFVAAACLTWGIVAAVGVEQAAYYLMPLQCCLYWLCSLPRASSFKQKQQQQQQRSYGGNIPEASLLMGPLEACLHTLSLVFLPMLLHIGIHHRKSVSANLLCELLLLFFIPFLFQMVASSRGALWWLSKDQEQLRHFRLVNGAISAVVVVLALQVRVVLHAFTQYLQLPSPWSYVLVTAACLAGLAALGLCFLGAPSLVPTTLCLVVAAVASAVVVGMPLKFIAAPVVAASFLAHYICTRNLLSYMVCVTGAGLSLTWFMVHHFWSLNVWLGGASLQSTCKLVIATALVALSTPALTTLSSSLLTRHATDAALVVHAVLVSFLENRLYNYGSLYYYGMEDDVVYPSYAVVTTTAVGLLITRRLKAGNQISSLGSWFLTCLYAAKLSMLLLSSSRAITWVATLFLLAVSPPLLLYNRKGASRMKAWQGVAHAAVIVVLVWICKETVSDAIHWWSGSYPSGSLLLGALLLVSGLASAPIVFYHFNHIQTARKALVLLLLSSAFCILLQPPLPKALSPSNPFQYWAADDVLSGTGSAPGWSTWLLLVAAVTSLAALTSALPVRHSVLIRLLYAVGLGLCIGLYLCVEHFPGGFIMHGLLVGTITCASVTLLFVLLPSELSPRFVPWSFALLVGLLPAMYMLESLQYGYNNINAADADGEEEKLLFSVLALQGAHTMLLGVYATIFMLVALVIKLQLTSILREKQQQEQQHGSFVPKHRLFVQQQHQQRPLGVKKLAVEGAWMPAVGNVATLLCFVLCMILNYHVGGGSHRAILFVAPVLLLLNQDSNLLAGFGDKQRYFPLSAAVSLYLTLAAAYELWAEVWSGGGSLYFVAKNMLLLLLTLPGHGLFNVFMWNYVTRSSSSRMLLLAAPLNVPALIATDVGPVRALALLAVLYALVQFAISRHLRIAGLKYV